MKYPASILIGAMLFINTFAQEIKTVEAIYISTPLSIDGYLDEPVYQDCRPAKDFVQLQPHNGKPAMQRSEVCIFYDDNAIYVGAMLYDSAPDSIFNYLTERDVIGMSDYFGIYLDPYNQGQLAYGFFITPAGVQTDLKAIKREYDYEDGNWNAVWESKTRITDDGWVIEMRIPYAALRFSEKSGDTWGLNMFRNIRRYNSNNSWNFIDRNIDGFIHQQGQLTNIKDIKPPVRLSFSPYLASYYESKVNESSRDFLYKGGMDVKYGISESFTLDMMLIPDFGQVQSDDRQLNLSPYELYYDEKRQFFTEGIELFQRGGIFYSRRIGTYPKFSANDKKDEHEIIDFNPIETQLVNATKISGRTNTGWGLGVLNAMSLSSRAVLKDTLSGDKRDVNVQPFTNYNVSVIDKSLKNNSYASIINTNVSMTGHSFMANVTATEFQLNNKERTYSLKGKGGVSTRGEDEYDNGYYAVLGLEKTKGKLRAGVSQNIYSDKYNPNDLGFLHRNNINVTETWIYHQKIEPFWVIREYNWNVWWAYMRIYNPNTLFGNEMGYNFNVNFTNNYYFNVNGGYSTDKYDFFETRTEGRFFKAPWYNWYNLNLSTDNRKNINFYFYFGQRFQPEYDLIANNSQVNTNIRVGQRLNFTYSISYNNKLNERGFVDKNDQCDSIIFSKRDVNTFVNRTTISYVINNNASLGLRARHYWSASENKDFYLLQKDGSLVPETSYTSNNDQNYNAFTIDLVFRWIFAPGSELTLAWKSAAYGHQDMVIYNYWDNLSDSWLNQSNSLSLKVLYYIDYNNLGRKKV